MGSIVIIIKREFDFISSYSSSSIGNNLLYVQSHSQTDTQSLIWMGDLLSNFA